MDIQVKEKLIAAKVQAEKLKKLLISTKEKSKVTSDRYKFLIQSIDSFLKCNLSDKSIYNKYERMRSLIS